MIRILKVKLQAKFQKVVILLKRGYNLNTNNSNNCNCSYNNNNFILQTFLNVISVIFIIFVIYKLFLGLSLVRLYALIISLIISFLISSFISNKFNYSNNKFVKILQKTVVFSFIIILGIFVLFYFNINIIFIYFKKIQ